MAILEKEVMIPINQRNINYYKRLNYKDIKINDIISVKIDHLSNSNRSAKLTKVCDNPNCDVAGGRTVGNQSYQNIFNNRKNNEFSYDLCKNCGKLFSWQIRKSKIQFEKSLEYYAKTHNKQQLIAEYSNKNEKRPYEISFSTLDKYLWDCPICNSEYEVSASSRTNTGSGCPYCHGKAVNYTNCLWTTHPHIAKLLIETIDGYSYTKGTHKKADFKCPDCNHIVKNKSITRVVYQGLSCPNCSDSYSYPEKFMFNLLSQIDVEFEFQKMFNWSSNRKYDFYIPSKNCIIETHGSQHYRYTGFARSLEDEQQNDRLKMRAAKENNISNYISIDCSKSDMEFIKNNIYKSKITSILGQLNAIDWLKCNEYACSSLLKSACNLWNNGYKVKDIMNQLKLSKFPIIKYLKQGTKLGWCQYDPKEEMRINGTISGKKSRKQVREEIY